MQHRAGWASLPPGTAAPGPWTAEEKREANFCASVAVKVSFLPSFLIFGDALSPLLFPVPQPGPKPASESWQGVVWDAEPRAARSLSVLCLPGREGGTRGGRGLLAKPFATAFAEPGGNSGLSSAFSSQLCLGNFGVKSRFLNSPTSPRADF